MAAQPPRKVIHLPRIKMMKGIRAHTTSGIRITNIKSIKPADPEIAKKQEENKLRAQLQKEIVSRSRTCANPTYVCGLPVVSGGQYCGRHAALDPNSGYRLCAHQYGNGQRCSMPAPAQKEHGMCFEHARASLSARQRSAAPPPQVTTTETLLHQLNHYVRPERVRTTSCASSVSVVSDPAEQEQAVPPPVDPFKQIDATAVNASYSASIMECASASDSDCDSVTVGVGGDCRGGHDEDCSDTEEAECDKQPLWHAGVFTAEEAVSEAKNVLTTLQSAYIQQMNRLRVLLQTARLQYLRTLKAEKEQYCSINSQARNGPLTVRERTQLRKLKAYAGYHKKHGMDAVLARKLMKKRSRVNETPWNRPVPSQGRCTFTEGGVRCPTQVLPAAKHCLKHILQDRHQVLFGGCEDPRGGVSCREPVPRLPLPSAACRYHTDPPLYVHFTAKKDDSETETGSHSSSDTQSDGDMDGDRPDINTLTEATVNASPDVLPDQLGV